MDFQFEGMAELQRRLAEMANFQSTEKQTLEKAGEHLRDKLEEKVYSFGFKKRTGKSAKSFVLKREIINGSIKVGLSNQNNDAFYLYYHEHGTSKMPARPFMRPTFEQEKQKIEQIMAEEIRRGLGI